MHLVLPKSTHQQPQLHAFPHPKKGHARHTGYNNAYEITFSRTQLSLSISIKAVSISDVFDKKKSFASGSGKQLSYMRHPLNEISPSPLVRQNFEASLEALRPAAREMRGKMIFVYLDPDSDENEKALEFFGVEDPEEDLPLYMIMEMEKNAKFMSDKNVDVDADEVKEFCNKHQVRATILCYRLCLQKGSSSSAHHTTWDAPKMTCLLFFPS